MVNNLASLQESDEAEFMSGGLRMTSAEYEAYEAKRLARKQPTQDAAPRSKTEISEKKLHDQIIKYAAERGYLLFYSAMDRKTSRRIGEFDFTCCLPGGRIIFAECKVCGRKPSESQLSVQAWLRKLGHTAEIISSLSEFEQLCGKANASEKEDL